MEDSLPESEQQAVVVRVPQTVTTIPTPPPALPLTADFGPVTCPRNLGHYELVAAIGRGGMACVFQAKDRRNGALVALKVLPLNNATKEYVERFRREAMIGRHLRHPSIIQTLEVGNEHSFYFLAMEFAEGGNAEQLLEKHRTVTERRALEIGRDLALALHCAQEKGVIHRDIKPANVLFDTRGRAKLTDFGLVRHFAAPDLTQAGNVVGTPYYMPPEQIRGERDLDVRSDLYGLGATLYHLLVGQPPFADGSSVEIMGRHLHDSIPPPSLYRPDLSPACEALLLKLLQKERDKRYGSALELACDLDRMVRGHAPVFVQPGSRKMIARPPSKRSGVRESVRSPSSAATSGYRSAVRSSSHGKQRAVSVPAPGFFARIWGWFRGGNETRFTPRPRSAAKGVRPVGARR